MLGAIAGDIIGSRYETHPIRRKDFPLIDDRSYFTDDTVLTVATARALLEGQPFASAYREFARRYPAAGFGGMFLTWALSDSPGVYGSWGNGSAMRVAPVGYAAESVPEVMETARRSAEVTHDHPEGIKGAQATALAVYLAHTGRGKEEIRRDIGRRFAYDLSRSADRVRATYRFDPSCGGTVPEAVICFLESTDYADAIRNAVSLGGDSDTLACIAGGIAEAYYGGIPREIESHVRKKLPAEFLDVVDRFRDRYPPGGGAGRKTA